MDYEEYSTFLRQAYKQRSHLIAQAKTDYYVLPKCDQPFAWVALERQIASIHSKYIDLRNAANAQIKANPFEKWRFHEPA